MSDDIANPGNDRRTPTISFVTERGLVVELLYRAAERRTLFAIGRDNEWRMQEKLVLPAGEILVPYSASNNLIRNECVLLPSEPVPYSTLEELVQDIENYLAGYVTLSAAFKLIAPWYVLLSWVHDAFNELPYLRFRGEFGTGKTRALLTLGSICYKPFFASGASTSSPIFHTLNSFGGTLVLDEADFRSSDERSDIVKILNNGNVRGIPVLRTIVSKDREFNPRAFRVFGPKIVAMRKDYDDRALESRFFTEETKHVPVGADIPLNLPISQKEEALLLRNKLLAYRFANLARVCLRDDADWPGDTRLRQTAMPLLSLVNKDAQREALRNAIASSYSAPFPDTYAQVELDLLSILVACFEDTSQSAVSLREIQHRLHATNSDNPVGWVSAKWLGTFLRKRLRLLTHKSNGVYVVPRTELPKVLALLDRHQRDTPSQPTH